MAGTPNLNPKTSLITNVYNGSQVLNPQWNSNSGNFGFDTTVSLPYVSATSTPTFVGASSYDITFSSFFAKIKVAPPGNGTIQTALIVKKDQHNFVEISVGPSGIFNAYGVVANSVVLLSSPLPAYDPTAHAFWRIRNDDGIFFHFDVSPDAVTWTELGNIPYTWDATAVTVSFFSGFSGIEVDGSRAYISSVNVVPGALQLKSTSRNTASVSGNLILNTPGTLSARVSGHAQLKAKFSLLLGVPEGGLTDFSMTLSNSGTVDPAISNLRASSGNAVFNGNSGTFTQAQWRRAYNTRTAPTTYRDGSYWQPSAYGQIQHILAQVPDSGTNLVTASQFEQVIGRNNRLGSNASVYKNNCLYAPQLVNGSGGSMSVTRSSVKALTGTYSGRITYGGTPVVIGTGQNAYWIYPTFNSLVPIIGSEGYLASVNLSTTRANTNWFASLIFYDASWNIVSSGTTYLAGSVTNMNVHPGGGNWQQGTVSIAAAPATSVYVGVIPVVIASGTETVFVSNHSIIGVTSSTSDVPTAYTEPNTSLVNVKADRVNYCMNSGFNSNITGWQEFTSNTTGSPDPATLSWDGTVGKDSLGSLKMAFATPSGTFAGGTGAYIVASSFSGFTGSAHFPPVQGLKTGRTYTFSAWIKRGVNCPDVTMVVHDRNNINSSIVSTNTTISSNPSSVSNGWTQVSTTITIPPNGLTDYAFEFRVLVADIFARAPFSYWVDNILVEETNTPGTYFDGSTGSLDYVYEKQATGSFNRSYYYKDYVNKLLRLNTALPTVTPVGTTFTLQFAQPPTFS